MKEQNEPQEGVDAEVNNLNDEEMVFSGCMSCLNDGMSHGMMFVSYVVCIVLIGAGCFVSWLTPMYGIPFLVLCVAFSVVWSVFLHMYKDINPATRPNSPVAEPTEGQKKDE